MSEDLHSKLRFLEQDYLGQPVFVQRADLREINHIRSQLGLPLVDAHLKEIAAAAREDVEPEAQPVPEEMPDHSGARQTYQAYLKKIAELEAHRAYADEVARATAGDGQTPVRALATMGTGSGPLLCDHCGKPMVLEGGSFHGMAADAAWKQNPRDDWTSWILGGMVVEIQTNGTLRIYHGYPGRKDNHCCNVAAREDEQARAEFKAHRDPEKTDILLAFLEHEFPDMKEQERLELFDKIVNTMYTYDPGLGINRPSRER
jgi:hypothetical protein